MDAAFRRPRIALAQSTDLHHVQAPDRKAWAMVAFLVLALLQNASNAPPHGTTTPPHLLNRSEVITDDDYPIVALKQQQDGIVSIQVSVSPVGRVTSCAVTETSGSPILDNRTCLLMQKRARFAPALDAAGQPVASEFRLAYGWGTSRSRFGLMLSARIPVPQLPIDYRMPTKAEITFDATGKAIACTIAISSGSAVADHTVCDFATAQLTVERPRTRTRASEPIAVRYLIACLADRRTSGLQRPMHETSEAGALRIGCPIPGSISEGDLGFPFSIH